MTTKRTQKLNQAAMFSTRELATILAALRLFQEQDPDSVAGMDQFYDEKPLSAKQIDELCARINR